MTADGQGGRRALGTLPRPWDSNRHKRLQSLAAQKVNPRPLATARIIAPTGRALSTIRSTACRTVFR